MPVIEVNKEKIELSQSVTDNTLKSIIPEISRIFSLSEQSITSILLNGSIVRLDWDKASLVRPLSREDVVSVNVDANLRLNVLKEIDSLIEGIISKIDCTDYSDMKSIKLNMDPIVSGIQTFIQASAYISSKANFISVLEKERLPMKSLQIHLLSVLKALNSAYLSSDSLMLEDLLDFELKDNLTKWKILVLPQLKMKLRQAV